MTRNLKNRPASVRFAMIMTVLSVVAPFGGFWASGPAASEAQARVVHFDADHPVNNTPVFTQDPGYVAMVD